MTWPDIKLPSNGIRPLKWTAFVGGPFSAALTIESGIVTEFNLATRSALDRVHAIFSLSGFGLLSSHLAEDYGREIHEETLVQRDNAWLKASDVYVATLPWSEGAPVRSDGTFVEIGLALGLGVPCVLLIENGEDPQWSYYVRNLHKEPAVLVLPLETPDAEIIARVIKHIEERNAAVGFRNRTLSEIDAHVLHALSSGGKAGHTVVRNGHVLEAPSNVLTSRYCASIDRLDDLCLTVSGQVVIEIGFGIGEVTIGLLERSNTVFGFEPDRQIAEVCQSNVIQAGLEAGLLLCETAAAQPAELILAHFPPLAAGVDPFAKRRTMLLDKLQHVLATAAKGTPVWIGVGVPGQVELESTWIERLGIVITANKQDQEAGVFRGVVGAT